MIEYDLEFFTPSQIVGSVLRLDKEKRASILKKVEAMRSVCRSDCCCPCEEALGDLLKSLGLNDMCGTGSCCPSSSDCDPKDLQIPVVTETVHVLPDRTTLSRVGVLGSVSHKLK